MTSFANAIIAIINALLAPILRIDLRAWFTIFLGALVWRIIEIVANQPTLTDNSSFMQLITPIAGAGGLLLIVTFLFGSNKESVQKSDALRDNARTMREAGIPVGPPSDPKKPVDVNVVNPYDAKTDDELRQILLERAKDEPDVVAAMDRTAMLARLAELDALPQEPR